MNLFLKGEIMSMAQLKYKRVLLKISGEALAGDKHFGFDFDVVSKVCDVIKKCTDMGVQMGVVIGGGNFWRGVKNGEAMVYSMHISPYDKGNIFNRDPDRPKRLLMHKREIRKLHEAQKLDGYALIPLSVYFKNGLVKVELGVCKGKKNYDKRQAIAERDAKREMDRARRERY